MRHILVADDDPSTRQFLAGALTSLGYRIALAEDGAQAVMLGRTHRYDALLLDCRMPGAGAADVLAALRADGGAASRNAVALATSAEVSTELRMSLIAGGFVGVVEKPCRLASLEHALAAMLGVDASTPVLDDQKALDATGDPQTMNALRTLLHDELRELDGILNELASRPDELVERLHRLRSACGFCGTSRLGAQARALQNHTLEAKGVASAALDRFRVELAATLEALRT